MAIPVIAGIPWLVTVIAGFLSSIFGAVLSFISQYISHKAASFILFVTLIGASSAGFLALISSLMDSIVVDVPDFVRLAAQLVIPENAGACVSVMVSGRLARLVYDWNVKAIQYKLL